MYEQVEKPKENKNKAVANSVAQKRGNGAVSLADNRLEVLSLKNQNSLSTDLTNKANKLERQGGCKQLKIIKESYKAPFDSSMTFKNASTNPIGHKAGYDPVGFVSGLNPYWHSRGHLVGKQFGGYGNSSNIVNQTDLSNNIMARTEDDVFKYSSEHDNSTIEYAVVANYKKGWKIKHKETGKTVLDDRSPYKIDISAKDVDSSWKLEESFENDYGGDSRYSKE